MPLIFTARKNQKLIVSKRQFDILVGSILGDAYITKLGKIQIEHAISQTDYLRWKFKELSSISYSGISFVKRIRNRKETYSCRFWTRQFFKSLRAKFYQSRHKCIPPEIVKLLTPFSLAVWYMDDGHLEKDRKRCIIATDGFDLKDLEILQSALYKRFKIDVTIKKDKKLLLNKNESLKFLALIDEYKNSSMAYKFLNPLTTKT